tara:strand:- start:14348 stop:14602 length:255 start_codon:yes stop_codon:yes gene_type:complete
MDKRLLTILRCPVTRKGLDIVNKDVLERLNAAIEAGELVNNEGAPVVDALDEALITDDGKRIYPIDDGIPVLLEDESINMEQLD